MEKAGMTEIGIKPECNLCTVYSWTAECYLDPCMSRGKIAEKGKTPDKGGWRCRKTTVLLQSWVLEPLNTTSAKPYQRTVEQVRDIPRAQEGLAGS